MHPLFVFLAGAATALAVALLVGALRRRRTEPGPQSDPLADPRADAPSEAQPAPQPAPEPARPPATLSGPDRVELELARRLLDETTRDLESLACGLGDELATMASSIEGHAQLLCEAIGEPHLIAQRADLLWTGVRRLRMFSEKILSFAQVDSLPVARVEVRSLLGGIAQDIEDAGSRLKVRVTTAEYLPAALASGRALRNAMLFLVDTLLRIETRASRLELRAYAQVFEDQDTRVRLEIWAEADEAGAPHEPTDHAVHLGYIAARNLLEAQGAKLAFDEVEGLSVACFISLPTAQDLPVGVPPAAEPPREFPAEPHLFGGVLILESDPEIRTLIAHELRTLGRKMVSCVDGASARSLIEATPDRFELAVLDAEARVENGRAIAALAAERIPGVQILLLSTGPVRPADLPHGANVEILQKPFGLHELRDALRGLLSGSPTGS
jgi:CheY-like chemotaxis protein